MIQAMRLFCLAMLAVAFFGSAAAAEKSCETPAQFIKNFEATHAGRGEIEVAFHGSDEGTVPVQVPIFRSH